MTWAIGVDIGGTFTDLVAIHATSGLRIVRKVLTTPREPLIAVLAALDEFERAAGGVGAGERPRLKTSGWKNLCQCVAEPPMVPVGRVAGE